MSLAEGSIRIRDLFPGGMSSIAEEMYPSAKYERTSVDDYKESLRLQGRLTPAVQDSIEKARLWQEETGAIIYIAGALTGVNELTKERYGEVSALLDSYGSVVDDNGKERQLLRGYVPHLHGTDPVKHPNVTSQEVRDIDHLWAVIMADAHVNFLHPIAHGNAIEFGWAEDHLIPTATQNIQGNRLSRLVSGMDNVANENGYEVFKADGMNGLRTYTDEFAAWLRTFPDRDPREFFYMSPKTCRTPTLIKEDKDPTKLQLVFQVTQFLVYVKDSSHSRYGQVGQYTGYDREYGMHHVAFPDGKEEYFYDGLEREYGECPVSFWLN